LKERSFSWERNDTSNRAQRMDTGREFQKVDRTIRKSSFTKNSSRPDKGIQMTSLNCDKPWEYELVFNIVTGQSLQFYKL